MPVGAVMLKVGEVQVGLMDFSHLGVGATLAILAVAGFSVTADDAARARFLELGM